MQLLQKKELCPILDFELNGDKDGTIEYILSYLVKKRNDCLEDRRLVKDAEIEETKTKLENILKYLIHLIAEKLDIPINVKAYVTIGFYLDLINIIEDETLPNFNKELFIKDATRELKENHLYTLEKEFHGPLKHFVSSQLEVEYSNTMLLFDVIFKIKWNEDPYFRDDYIRGCQLDNFLCSNKECFFLIKGENETGKSTMSK